MPLMFQNILLIQSLRYFRDSLPGKIRLKDISNDLGALLINYNFSVPERISEWDRGWEKCPAFHAVLIAPAHFSGEALAFLLCDGGEDSSEQLAAHIGGVDVL